jgi:hypothetical protein
MLVAMASVIVQVAFYFHTSVEMGKKGRVIVEYERVKRRIPVFWLKGMD